MNWGVLALSFCIAVLLAYILFDSIGWMDSPFRKTISSFLPSELRDVVQYMRSSFDQTADLSGSFSDTVLRKQIQQWNLEFLTSSASVVDVRYQLTERDDDVKFLQEHLRVAPGEYLLDIGANIGTYSVMLSKLFPQARILAFEPMPTTFSYLQHNLYVNNASNVKAYNFGIGPTNRRMVMHYMPKWPGMSMMRRRDPKHMLPVAVSTVTFNAVLASNKIDRVKLLKIDCEACEYEVMRTINLSKVQFLCGEIHSGRGTEVGYDAKTINATDFIICTHNKRRNGLPIGACLADINKRCPTEEKFAQWQNQNSAR